MKDLVMDYPTSISLESQVLRLAAEADAFVNVIDTFRNIIPKFKDAITAKLSSIADADEDENTKELLASYTKLDKKAQVASFATYSKTLVSVPENFKGKYIDYAKFLNKANRSIYNETVLALQEYKTILITFLSDPSLAITTKDNSEFYGKLKKAREDTDEEYAKYFPRDTGLSKQQLGTVVSRFADFKELYREIETLVKYNEKSALATVKKLTAELTELLGLVIKRTEKDSCERIDPMSAKNISNGAYEIAQYVERVAVFRFRVMQFTASIENTIEQLNTILS